ncbi:torsin-1A-interacting protein 2-like isoform X2 [Pungitius pungitius]|uniref:torsin-1A-interacting protein 2-like isoform X2 n=1 Tax=Pungitius pungitius TaxID=134920 RepID=UPI002E15C793
MAERETDHQHTAGGGGDGPEAQAKEMDHISASDEGKQEETDQRLSEASSSASTTRETDGDGDVVMQHNVKNGDSAGERTVPPTEGFSPPEEDARLNVEDKRNALQPEEESHGDYTRQREVNDLQPKTTEEISTIVMLPGEAPRTTSPLTLDRKKGDVVDRAVEKTPDTDAGEGDKVDGAIEETPDSNTPDTDAGEGDKVDGAIEETPDSNTPDTDAGEGDEEDGAVEETPDTDAGEADESSPGKEEEVPKGHIISPQRGEHVETIGPTPEETADVPPAVGGVIRGGTRPSTIGKGILIGIGVVVIAALVQQFLKTQVPPPKDEVRPIDIFLGQLERVKTQFPHQRAELWNRSKIHLLRHLRKAQPTEPVSLILTAGRGGERTLQCLAQRLASAFSSSLNASVLHIDGASKASEDSDQVKLDIDSKLQGAFEGDKPVAVINRFEELPPGATLIFYRYCDHENAAYKKTFMIFTVLLGEKEEIPADTRLTTVEEMVDDHLQKKFLSEGHPVSFDRMDLDKYGGLWSRISHLILPVAAEEKIEHGGCQAT